MLTNSQHVRKHPLATKSRATTTRVASRGTSRISYVRRKALAKPFDQVFHEAVREVVLRKAFGKTFRHGAANIRIYIYIYNYIYIYIQIYNYKKYVYIISRYLRSCPLTASMFATIMFASIP